MPFSYETFLEQCRGNVSPALWEMLRELTAESDRGPLLEDWAPFYRRLKEELTYQRNMRLGKNPAAPAFRDEWEVRVVTAAMNEKNPWQAEKILLAMEFEKLDELVTQHYFDQAALIGYALKLKLLERKTIFRKEAGRAELEGIVTGLQEQIMNM